MKKFLSFLMLTAALCGERIDIITHFDMDTLPADYAPLEQAGIEKKVIWVREYQPHDDADLRKIFVINPILDLASLAALPKEKLVLFNWEPDPVPAEYFEAFSKVYTWNDTLVDNEKFFKVYYPFRKMMREHLKPYQERKFCTLIASNWTKFRLEMLSFFARKPKGDLEFYGFKTPYKTPMYKGPAPGWHSGEEKFDILEQYKFCICFENVPGLVGYVTEKIFACFVAGCLPVYWGPTNIEDYIPKNCFIDYRDFSSKEQLYKYLKAMPEVEYLNYLDNIRSFLASEKAQLFTEEQLGEAYLHALE